MWYYQNEPVENVPEGMTSFVYLITNNTNGRMYIGKKLAITNFKRPPLKGKKRKRIVQKNTDWKKYWGSSQELLDDVTKLGEDKFTRQILYWCSSKSVASYLEAKEQFDRNVLMDDNYYNGIIDCRIKANKTLFECLKDK